MTVVKDTDRCLFSQQDLNILACICSGLQHKETERILKISVKAIEKHITKMGERTGSHGKSGLVQYAQRMGLLQQLKNRYISLLIKHEIDICVSLTNPLIHGHKITCTVYSANCEECANGLTKSLTAFGVETNLVTGEAQKIEEQVTSYIRIVSEQLLEPLLFTQENLTKWLSCEVILALVKDKSVTASLLNCLRKIKKHANNESLPLQAPLSSPRENSIFKRLGAHYTQLGSFLILLTGSILVSALTIHHISNNQTLSNQEETSQNSLHFDWQMPHLPVQRVDKIMEIEHYLNQTTQRTPIVWVVGFPNSGKTTLVHSFVKQYLATHRDITFSWYVNASTNACLARSFLEIADRLTACPEEKNILRI